MTCSLNKHSPTFPFNSTLFWDVEKINLRQHAFFIIGRVLDFGDEKDVKQLKSIYSDQKIIQALKNQKGLHPITANFWAIHYQIPKKDIPCLRKY